MHRRRTDGVPYTFKSKRSNEFLGFQWSNLINTEYNFYVKPEDEGRAYKHCRIDEACVANTVVLALTT